MKQQILTDGDLQISITRTEQRLFARLKRKNPDRWDSADMMVELLEPVVRNSGLEWARPEWIGALTSAPILITLGESRRLRPGEVAGRGNRPAGRHGEGVFVHPIEFAWGFMDYQIESVQGRLLDRGWATFRKEWTA
jgi:hypothetical protein